MNICITGAFGFIGGELIKKISENPNINITALDYKNKKNNIISFCQKFIDWQDAMDDFMFLDDVDFVYHLGANSSTRATKEELYLSNISFTEKLMVQCSIRNIPMVFASSGAIYGSNRIKDDKPNPLTEYGKSKLIGEKYAMSYSKRKIVCLRYHNVYGPTESHKDNMASIISKWIDDYKNGITQNVLFYGSSKIIRDFIHVDDITKINIMFLDYYKQRGTLGYDLIIDVGTGLPTSFQDVAENIIKNTRGSIKYVDNPYNETNYQFYTEANISQLENIYYSLYGKEFTPLSIEEGILKTFNQKTK